MKYNTQNAKNWHPLLKKTLIVGIDVGSETHFVRAFDWRNYEFTKKPFEFSNSEAGISDLQSLDGGSFREKWQIRCDSWYGANRSLLVRPGKIPAGQWNEAGACKSPSRKKVERTGRQ